MQERLQKIMSRAGIASRRKAEEMILQGQVRVNGELVTELGSKADPETDNIRVAGKAIRSSHPVPLYLALNKPRNYITTTHDPEGRPTVMDLLGRYRSRVYPVGRLDYASEGLLLLSNDGDFANHVLSAKNLVPKTYLVKVSGRPSPDDLEAFRSGVRLDGRPTAPAQIRQVKPGENPWFEVTLIEGRNNQIRRMFRKFGFHVEKLKRTKVGPVALGTLLPGHHRPLTAQEVHRFQKLWNDPAAPRVTEAKKPRIRVKKTA
jgi:23S rRNA pseudouridine2605 synthase